MNPIEMSKEVMAAISNTYDLESYSSSELRSLFDDWLGEIEKMVVDFINRRKRADPDAIAAHLNLQSSSVIFILGKLAKEGRINVHASGSKKCVGTTTSVCKGKIKLRRTK